MAQDKIKVGGVAIREGISRNGVMYLANELAKFAPTLENRPILKDHESRTDNTIGKVTKGVSVENGKQVMYSGWIKEDGTGIVEKIKDGRISEVSIGAMCGKLVKESEDSDILIAKDMTAMEISTTPTPGVHGTSISVQVGKTLQNSINEEVENYIISREATKLVESYSNDVKSSIDTQNNQKEVKMESTQEKTEVTTTSEAVTKETLELKAKLLIAEQAVASMKETQRLEAIAAYKAKCEVKKLPAQDASNMTIETVKALIAVVDSIPAVTENKIEVAEKAVAKSKAVSSIVTETAFDGYVIESSTLGGISFYKTY